MSSSPSTKHPNISEAERQSTGVLSNIHSVNLGSGPCRAGLRAGLRGRERAQDTERRLARGRGAVRRPRGKPCRVILSAGGHTGSPCTCDAETQGRLLGPALGPALPGALFWDPAVGSSLLALRVRREPPHTLRPSSRVFARQLAAFRAMVCVTPGEPHLEQGTLS